MKAAIISLGSVSSKWTAEAMRKYFDSVDEINLKEIEVNVSDFKKTSKILEIAGLKKVGYQESYRELWEYDNVEIMIDTWPFLKPLVEVEGKNENDVKKVSEELGFDYNNAIFGSVEILYSEKFNINKLKLCEIAPILKFESTNPFLKD